MTTSTVVQPIEKILTKLETLISQLNGVIRDHHQLKSTWRIAIETLAREYHEERRSMVIEKAVAEGVRWCANCREIRNIEDLLLVATRNRHFSEMNLTVYCYPCTRFGHDITQISSRLELIKYSGFINKLRVNIFRIYEKRVLVESDPELVTIENLAKRFDIPPALNLEFRLDGSASITQ